MFRFKRAHYASLRVERQLLERWAPLTPARFDLLFVVHEAEDGAIDQATLTEKLGVHHSTVSKMLKRLDELGLVKRGPVPGNRRRRRVTLTAKGRRLIARAAYDVRGNGYLDLAVSCAMLPLRWYDDRRVRAKLRRINGTLRRYALTFWDTAIALYGPIREPRNLA